MSDLDLRKLRYFLVVAEELNYGRAAERLHIAQPVLSRQITALEGELGATLFERSSRGTRLTETGTALVDDARALLAGAAALQRRARTAGRQGPHLTIGFMPGLIITSVVRDLVERFPGLTVDVQRTGWDTQVETLLDGSIDASFVRLPVPRRGLHVIELLQEPRVAVLPTGHPLLELEEITLAALTAENLLQDPDAVPEWRDAVLTVRPNALSLDRIGLPVVNTVEEKLEYVAAGRGIVILPASTAAFYTRGDVVSRAVSDLPHGRVGLAIPADRQTPVLTALSEIAEREVDTLIAERVSIMDV
ncbi:DNA-binding transcriptional LysR family regulator [Mycetocola sp. BIGb0189]|uniref:LysR family transcriptional regulator n=1 Tax=Mycetocola sp. BIGb0189 TaxID=2940604 RepID=UPI00216A4C9F|nr:LysR substrate-binding domain-containing protein [Mycetocola sp. BIGb0189]MCS4275879.1 DNA-binding transcriptional LysR family regulator [Mycetocola sp. BIGb0189]